MMWYYNNLAAVKAIGDRVKEDVYKTRRGLRMIEDNEEHEMRSEQS